MRNIEPARWDDYALAFLLLLIAVPRLVIAIVQGRPFGVEDTLSILGVVLGLLILVWRQRRR